ncbi:VRR-NUC domain-containing protein, partial [Trueperella bernardiae]|nr:VRR-NUC domain-containing protein [Trueperella bernardiae]
MNEHAIEQHLKKAVEAIGGLCWKFTSPGTAGVPDRICI